MANHTWLYFLNTDEMSNHWVSVRTQIIVIKREDYPELFKYSDVTDDVITTSRKSVRSVSKPSGKAMQLLTWIAQDLEESEKQTADEAAYLQDIIGGFLFKHKPGMYWVGDFRHEWAFDEDLIKLCQPLPHIQQRLGIRAERPATPDVIEKQRREFLSNFNSPIRSLNFRGWTFLYPEDIQSLMQTYTQLPSNKLHHSDEWEKVFEAHRSHKYDLAAIIYTSLARML